MTKNLRQHIKQRAVSAYQTQLRNGFETSRLKLREQIVIGRTKLEETDRDVKILESCLEILRPLRNQLSNLVVRMEAQHDVLESSLAAITPSAISDTTSPSK